MEVFDELGRPNNDVEQIALLFEEQTKQFVLNMVNKGCTLTEIRAIGGYLSGSVDLGVSVAMLAIQADAERKQIENADPNLNEEEKRLARSNDKILAIKYHRDRTGKGLSESKKIVENWMKNNLF